MKTILAALALVALTGAAEAQQRTFRDSAGRTIGTASTDSRGSTTFRDSSGRTTGRSSTDGQGTTTVYDASGRVIGRSTTRSQR